jgi:hypothetical protein
MDTVYKVCLLGKNNAVKEIIVFSKKENEDASEHIFNSKEETFIEENNQQFEEDEQEQPQWV